MEKNGHKVTKLSLGGLLVAMGVVYGDIGTSPLYVMRAILEGNGGLANVSPDFILGAVSLIFWTLTLLTTVKYVIIALNADNHGEGGIFSLYSLVRHGSKYLIIPAMVGGAALLADGVLTPAVTVTTAVEGLRSIPLFFNRFAMDQNIIILITLIILLVLFSIQRFGTDIVGKAFGPAMLGWFTFLGVAGLLNFSQDLSVIRALNPVYAFKLLFSPENNLGLFILGNVFLATTGAEALYSDLGHVGKQNIRFSWPYIKLCLTLNYLGQAAWIISVQNDPHYQEIEQLNPFFGMLPDSWMIFGVVFATLAAIIASQALLSGSFTLVSEAIKLKLLPRLHILYPGTSIGQMYIPVVNFILWFICSLVVIGFRTSTNMEAAYGLAITVTMLMTTILLHEYLIQHGQSKWLANILTLFFASLEIVFFITSAVKFFHGGFVAVLMALAILAIMVIWQKGNEIKEKASIDIDLKDYIGQIEQLHQDDSVPMTQTNVVFLVPTMEGNRIGQQFLYSILDKRPKRAELYWFINVEVTDQPFTQEFEVDTMGTDFIVMVKLYLGFRVPQKVNIYIRQIIQELMEDGRIPTQPQRYSITPGRQVGDFQFVIIQESLSYTTEMTRIEKQIMQTKLFIKRHTMSVAHWFGLEYSDVQNEVVPLYIGKPTTSQLKERPHTQSF